MESLYDLRIIEDSEIQKGYSEAINSITKYYQEDYSKIIEKIESEFKNSQLRKDHLKELQDFIANLEKLLQTLGDYLPDFKLCTKDIRQDLDRSILNEAIKWLRLKNEEIQDLSLENLDKAKEISREIVKRLGSFNLVIETFFESDESVRLR